MPPEREGSKTLARGIDLLFVLAAHPQGLTVRELAEALGTHRQGVYRLLAPLQRHRLVARDADGRHRLGSGLVELARGVHGRLREVAEPVLVALADSTGLTAALTVRDDGDAGGGGASGAAASGGSGAGADGAAASGAGASGAGASGAGASGAVVVATREPRDAAMHVAYRPGLRHPLTRGAAGAALLAGAPPQPGEPEAVRLARERGYATSTGQLQPGAHGLAAPVLVAGAPAEAAVGVVSLGPIDPARVAPAVLGAARRIAAALS